MIDEIQALMPILEKISDGALWAFGIYMLVKLIGFAIWPVALAYVILKAMPIVARMFSKTEDRKLDLYSLRYKGDEFDAEYLGDKKTLAKFLRWARTDRLGVISCYLHSEDIEDIMKGKRAPISEGDE